ncbi:MAG: AraC family transcriptional regulator [Mesorhizobium sp.]
MPANGFIRLSTRSLPKRQRFEYWRDFHHLIDIDTPTDDGRAVFNADLLHYAGADDMSFGHTASGDTVARFTRSNAEFVLLSLTVSGEAELKTSDGAASIVTPASGLVVIDSARHVETRTRSHEHVYLTIPRAEIPSQIMADIADTSQGVCVLRNTGITNILTSHMLQIAQECERLSADAAAVAVRAARDLALASLNSAGSQDNTMLSGQDDHAIFIAAQRFISLHLSETNLTAERIAMALDCSRAHLYRVFAGRGEPIGQVIRTARLDRAARVIAANPGWPIDRVAALCGFANVSAFIRMFRRHQGITPAMFRDETRN